MFRFACMLFAEFVVRCALRAGSRLLSGASMGDYSMLLEHSLLTSGEIADEGAVYVGWPARPMEDKAFIGSRLPKGIITAQSRPRYGSMRLACPICARFPRSPATTRCGHCFCER
jgi:hypothetical protein